MGKLFRRRWVRIAGAAMLLPLLLLLVGAPLGTNSPLPDPFRPLEGNEGVAGELFVMVSGYLGTFAVALVIGSVILIQLREAKRPDSVEWGLGLAGALSAMLSIFLGFRFQMDVATQLSVYHLDVPEIIPSFHYQALFLTLSASLLTGLAVDRLARGGRAGRPRREEGSDD